MGYTSVMQAVAEQTRMRAMAWGPFDDRWYGSLGIDTTAGIDVHEITALTHPVFWACVKVVSETLATLPVHVYERVDEKTREPIDHWLNELLTVGGRDATGITIRESDGVHELTWGASFHEIAWNRRGDEPREIIPLQARFFDPIERDEQGKLKFVYNEPGSTPKRIPNDRMWYSPGISLNGITGMSIVAYHRETVGLGLAARQFRSAMFGNNCVTGGVMTPAAGAPGLSEKAGNRLLDSLREQSQSAKNAFKWLFLREPFDVKQFDMPGEDRLYLGLARPERVEMCGMFRLPPVFIGDDERATYHNTEQQGIQFATHCILPWCVRREASMRRRFFPGTKLYVRHNLAGLVRGDLATRMQAYNIGLPLGLWSIDEVRALEEMNPIPDGLGETRYRPLNMGILGEEVVRQVGGEQMAEALGQMSHAVREGFGDMRTLLIGQQVQIGQAMQAMADKYEQQGRLVVKGLRSVRRSVAGLQDTAERQAVALETVGTSLGELRQTTIEVGDRQTAASDRIAAQVTGLSEQLVSRPIDTFRPMIKSSAVRIASKEQKALQAAFRKHAGSGTPDGFREWAEKFYAGHADWIAQTFAPIFAGYEQATRRAVRPTAAEVAAAYCNENRATIVEAAEKPEELLGLLEKWDTSVAAELSAEVHDALSEEANDG